MTVLHPEEIRDMTPAERAAELEDLETELLKQGGQGRRRRAGEPGAHQGDPEGHRADQDDPAGRGRPRMRSPKPSGVSREEGDLDEQEVE